MISINVSENEISRTQDYLDLAQKHKILEQNFQKQRLINIENNKSYKQLLSQCNELKISYSKDLLKLALTITDLHEQNQLLKENIQKIKHIKSNYKNYKQKMQNQLRQMCLIHEKEKIKYEEQIQKLQRFISEQKQTTNKIESNFKLAKQQSQTKENLHEKAIQGYEKKLKQSYCDLDLIATHYQQQIVLLNSKINKLKEQGQNVKLSNNNTTQATPCKIFAPLGTPLPIHQQTLKVCSQKIQRNQLDPSTNRNELTVNGSNSTRRK